jgi:hypothetical protein
LNSLLEQSESEFLDFKQQYHSSNAKLVFDVLCLLNSDHEGDRYLVFGVGDDKTIHDISNDANRKTSAGLTDLFRGSQFNRLPKIKIITERIEEKSVDILVISNTRHKPYFLLADYENRGSTVIAGRIVTRVGDANTPTNRGAEDHAIEKMFVERFGLHLTPLERLKVYLEDIFNWIEGYNENKELFFYYSKFPEFTITKDSSSREPFEVEEWVHVFPDTKASSENLFLKYHATILGKHLLISCDGARYLTLIPQMKVLWKGEDYYRIIYFIEGSNECLINNMLEKIYKNQSRHYINGSILIFDNDEQKDEYLLDENNFLNGPSFFYSTAEKKKYKVFNGEKILLVSQ